MGSHKPIFAGVIVTIVLVLAACQLTNEPGTTPDSKPSPMRIVTDDLERRINIPVNVKRVVSTAPSITEMIFAAGGGDRLVGVTTFCDFPEEAKSIVKIGDTMNPNMETILALKPDIVFVSTASQLETFMNTLEQNVVAVYVMNPIALQDIFNSLRRLGEVFGSEDVANKMALQLEERAGLVLLSSRDTSNSRVFVQLSNEPLFTIGKTSFLNGLLDYGNAISVTADVETAFPKLSKESAAVLNPEVIFLSDSPDNQEPNDAFKNSPAVKTGRVHKINADILSRPGPRLVDALEQIATLLHPDKFESGVKEK